jgi:segregation and condensation protein A
MDNPAGYQVELDVFEGPLDLLLHLVKKHELSILDIPIAFVTEKYLSYLDAMQALDIDVAGEYLLMAATLCHIKSRELLPPSGDDDDEDGELGEAKDGDEEDLDPRADLIKRLLEYQKYKEAADQLGQRPVVGRNVWSRGASAEDAVAEGIDADAIAPLAQFPVHKLIEAFDRVMRQAKIKVSHEVTIDRLSVSQKIAELTDRLEASGRITFSSMFAFLRDGVARTIEEVRHEAVVTFLALLEMAKLQLITLRQHVTEGTAPAADGAGPGGIEVEVDEEEIYIERASADMRARMAQTVARSDDYR